MICDCYCSNGAADEDEPWSETVSLDHNDLENIAVDNENPMKLSVHLHGGNFKRKFVMNINTNYYNFI